MSHAGFVVEGNNWRVYRTRLVALLEQNGRFDVEHLPHKTAVLIRYGIAKKFVGLKKLLRGAIRQRIGGVTVVSRETGTLRILSNRGNRAGRWIWYRK